jgi:predicted helicase
MTTFDWTSWYNDRKEELYRLINNEQAVENQLTIDKIVVTLCLKSPVLYDVLNHEGRDWKKYLTIDEVDKEIKVNIN